MSEALPRPGAAATAQATPASSVPDARQWIPGARCATRLLQVPMPACAAMSRQSRPRSMPPMPSMLPMLSMPLRASMPPMPALRPM
eukprot:11206236-Lingulodinium_polyedra.AAC.1